MLKGLSRPEEQRTTVAELPRTPRKSVMRLLNSCLVEEKELTRDDVLGGFISRVVPADLLSPGLDPSEDEQPWLHLTGESYRLYYESLFRLSTDLALEYLSREEIDRRLWHLVCETAGAEGDSRTKEGNKKRLDDFINKFAKPIVEYEVLIPIDHLDVGEKQVPVQTILLKRMMSAELREWGLKGEKDIEKLNGRTFAIAKETGTSPRKVIGRARSEIQDGFDILVTALAARRQIRDEELMFDLAELAFTKDPLGAVEGWYERSYQPMDLKLTADSDESLEDDIRKLADFLASPQVAKEMKNRLKVCLANLRKASQSSRFDDKVNSLFSGLEALLQTLDDPHKGEAIAARLMLLSTAATGKFFDPALTLALYDLRRSRTVHGENIDIAHEKEYQDVLVRANQAIRAFADIVLRENLRDRQALFNWLMRQGKAPDLIGWLKNHPSEYAERIREWLEDQRGKVDPPTPTSAVSTKVVSRPF